jgi:hypothetical protein
VRGETTIIIQGKGFGILEDEDGVYPRCRLGTAGNYAVVEATIICKILIITNILNSLRQNLMQSSK